MIQDSIKKLVEYGLLTGLIEEEDKIYTTNRLLELFGLDELEDGGKDTAVTVDDLEAVLKDMLDYACEKGLTEDSVVYRDLSTRRSWDCLRPDPAR